jgi:16S rRNA (adenine1518-N6/adenine1519-N6)-dimethyltransferase
MDKNSLKTTEKIMRDYQARANKRYGQNFLIDDGILENIIGISNITDEDLVIEIGPGLGNLTELLLKNSGYLILIEIDDKMINILNDRFKNETNYLLINEDVLKLNIDNLIENIEKEHNKKYRSVKVVANLPYYITTPIIFKLLQDTNRVSEIIVMVQKEVAKRMIASPKTKDYSILTLMVKYYAISKIEINVPNTSFLPAPKVESAVISLKKEKRYNTSNEALLFELIHKSFAQRRKKMINSLTSTSFNDKTKEELETVFAKCNIDLNSRAEELELIKFIEIIENL